MSSTQNYVSKQQLLNTSYGMIALTSAFVLARVAIQVSRPKKLGVEDYLVYVSYAFYLAMSILYIVVTPPLFKISDVTSGKAPPYPTILDDTLFLIKVFFANTTIFWLVLWTVKFSLLALYRRLMVGLKSTYIMLWWAVFAFCVLSLIGCIVSNITSCHSMHAWFTPGECATPRDVRAQIASLYYAYAVDVLTDFMIMFLPIRLVANLQMPRSQKISVIALFCTGLVCVLFATIRVVQIGVKAGNRSTPSSSWLALWAVVECSIAVIIGCCPAFAALYRKARNTHKGSYNAQGYSKQPSSRSGAQRSTDIKLKSMVTTGNRTKNDTYWVDSNSSQEELAKNGIMVTRTVRQEDERSNDRL